MKEAEEEGEGRRERRRTRSLEGGGRKGRARGEVMVNMDET